VWRDPPLPHGMKNPFNPVRLFAEILLIVGLSETAVMLVLPSLVPGLTGLGEGLVDVSMLICLAGPSVYWRCITALRRPLPQGSSQISPAEAQRFSIGLAVRFTATAQILGLLATTVLVLWLKHDLDRETQSQFDRTVERIETEVKRRFNQPLIGLKAARAAYAASDTITRREFQAYVETLDLATEFPGIRGFGFIAHVPGPRWRVSPQPSVRTMRRISRCTPGPCRRSLCRQVHRAHWCELGRCGPGRRIGHGAAYSGGACHEHR